MKQGNEGSIFRRLVRPLSSRKVRVAVATVIVAFAAEFGLDTSAELIATILGVGVALILGIAHEDAGRFAGTISKERNADA